MAKVVMAVDKSVNSKTGVVSATYAPIQSCPKTCPFLDSGCYAQTSFCGMYLKKLNAAARKHKKTRAVDIAREEAKAIRALKGKYPLRLHVVGDCKTPKAAELVAKAADDYTAKNKQPVWTYTHAWREIPREKWGNISVLASCETTDQAKQAMKRGYAASMVRIKEFNKPFDYKGLRMMPCLELTKGIQCNKCQLCFKDQKLLDTNKVVCFFPHGSGAEQARRAITSRVHIPKGN